MYMVPFLQLLINNMKCFEECVIFVNYISPKLLSFLLKAPELSLKEVEQLEISELWERRTSESVGQFDTTDLLTVLDLIMNPSVYNLFVLNRYFPELTCAPDVYNKKLPIYQGEEVIDLLY